MRSEAEPKSPELAAFVFRMLEMQNILNEDTAEALEMFRFGTPEFCTRTMVRTLSAEFEAQVYLLEQFVIGLNEASPDKFKLTPEESVILKDVSLNIKSSGTFSVSSKFYPFADRLLFVLSVATRIINPAAKPDTYCLNWESVKKFNEIRNRLTHPKKIKDLHISDDEIDHLNRAQDWIRGSMKALFNAGGFKEAVEKYAKESTKT